ncbi:uncharacterized protein [Aegilops tauschii subsp. strangulata]|uniref:uncharacterized protein n=1 Tax=Aegilops tauschii subsp. strangulata TaxID=200361 RepID=UPI003CC8701D
MIQERADYKALDPADILERLNTHEFQLAKKRDLYGSSYGRSRALKAKAVSESEDEDSDSSIGDPEELSHELAMLVRKFQKLSRRRFGKSSRSNDSSSSDYKKRLCHKCKKPGHYIQDCPQWEKESKKKKYKDYSSDDVKKKKKSSKSSSSKSSSHKKSSSKKARAFIGKEMDSEAESEENEEEEVSEESESGVASLALATAFVSKSIFNSEENGFTNKADEDNDDYAPTYCFMAKGAKVLKYPSSESSEDESDENLKPSYSKLAKIAVKQQRALEKRLQSKFDNLHSHHNTLLTDHEKLSERSQPGTPDGVCADALRGAEITCAASCLTDLVGEISLSDEPASDAGNGDSEDRLVGLLDQLHIADELAADVDGRSTMTEVLVVGEHSCGGSQDPLHAALHDLTVPIPEDADAETLEARRLQLLESANRLAGMRRLTEAYQQEMDRAVGGTPTPGGPSRAGQVRQHGAIVASMFGVDRPVYATAVENLRAAQATKQKFIEIMSR